MSRSPIQRFVQQLRRRHVPQTAAIYLVAAWAVIEFADVVVPNFNGPQWVVEAVIVAALAGFPVMLVIAWIFEWGPEGIHRMDDALEGMERPPTYDEEAGGVEPAPAGEPVAPDRAQPWLAAVAVLVVAVGSALAVAYVLRGDSGQAAAPAAIRPDTDRTARQGTGGGQPGGPGEPARPTPPGVGALEGVGAIFSDSIRAEIVRSLGALDSLDLNELTEAGRMAAEQAGVGIMVSRPAEWRAVGGEPESITLPEGAELQIEGVAFDAAGIVGVTVDGQEVAGGGEDGRRSVPFTATLIGRASAGSRVVSIVARTADGREIRREYTIIQLPGGTP